MAKNKRKGIDTTPAGLEVTSPDEVMLDEQGDAEEAHADIADTYDNDTVEDEQSDVVVSADVSKRHPEETIGAALIRIGMLYEDAGVVSRALSKHIRTAAGEPELHTYLHRMQVVLGDMRHQIEHIDAALSDNLRESIIQGVS